MTSYEKLLSIIEAADMELLDFIEKAIVSELEKRGMEVSDHE